MAELKPCPFCGKAAKLDTAQAYVGINLVKGERIVIYCTGCNADFGICREDLSGWEETDDVVAELAEGWNLRAGEEWRTIDTAPRSGRQLFLLLTPSRFPQVAWSDTWWIGGFSVECKPTHWLPIPALPEARS